MVANIGGLEDAQEATTKGAEGVGLLRSEFVFLGRTKAPTEDEQAEIYTAIARTLAPGQPLVIRTLDVGGDKPLPYLPIAPEENPFLGERGIRVGLNRPEVLRTQVRAILRAADAGAKINVMFPMIATIEDFRQAKAIFEEERAALGVAPVPVGIMVEVPSVAVMAPQFAAEVDFFSVGTNDLTQYTLAMDRGHPKLAPQVDGLNPAVLGLIALAAKAAHDAGRWVGVCGGMASDPQAVPILLGLGVDELSVSIPAIPAVKAQIRSLSLAQCQELAARALTQDSAAAVRALVPAYDDEEDCVMTTATETAPAPRKASLGSRAFGFLQKIGKSVMLPVSVLPVAGILLGVGGAFIGGYEQQRQGHGDLHPRTGPPSPCGVEGPSATRSPRGSSRNRSSSSCRSCRRPGQPIFGAMALIFAIGVALGLTKNDGVAALAAIVGYLVMNGTLGVVAAARGVETDHRSSARRRSTRASSAASSSAASRHTCSTGSTASSSRSTWASSRASGSSRSSRRSRRSSSGSSWPSSGRPSATSSRSARTVSCGRTRRSPCSSTASSSAPFCRSGCTTSGTPRSSSP